MGASECNVHPQCVLQPLTFFGVKLNKDNSHVQGGSPPLQLLWATRCHPYFFIAASAAERRTSTSRAGAIEIHLGGGSTLSWWSFNSTTPSEKRCVAGLLRVPSFRSVSIEQTRVNIAVETWKCCCFWGSIFTCCFHNSQLHWPLCWKLMTQPVTKPSIRWSSFYWQLFFFFFFCTFSEPVSNKHRESVLRAKVGAYAVSCFHY